MRKPHYGGIDHGPMDIRPDGSKVMPGGLKRAPLAPRRRPRQAEPMTERRRLIEDALTALAPALPPKDHREVVEHALWSKGLRHAAPSKAAWLSLVSYLRHCYTDYDQLLSEGYSADEARYFCADQISKVLENIKCRIKLR